MTVATSGAASSDSRPIAGILFLILATTVFPLQDVIIKNMSDEYAVHQLVFLRAVFALPILFVIAYFDGGLRPFRIGSFRLQLLRAAAGITSYTFFYLGLASMGMAEVVAIYFSTPIFVTILAIFFLGEKIGLFRWVAIFLGLSGVLVMVRPGSDVFDPVTILPLLAAFFYAVLTIATRKIGRSASGGITVVFFQVFYMVASGAIGLIFSWVQIEASHPSIAFLVRPWVWPEPHHWLLLVSMGAISAIGFYAVTQAYRLAEASVVTPFEYTLLPWTILWGFVFFGALPGMSVWIGISLVVSAGLLIVFREAVLGRRIVRRKGLGVVRQ